MAGFRAHERRREPLIDKDSPMDQVANGIGELTCNAMGELVRACQTGQSVAVVGHGVVAIVLLWLSIGRILGRPGPG